MLHIFDTCSFTAIETIDTHRQGQNVAVPTDKDLLLSLAGLAQLQSVYKWMPKDVVSGSMVGVSKSVTPLDGTVHNKLYE